MIVIVVYTVPFTGPSFSEAWDSVIVNSEITIIADIVIKHLLCSRFLTPAAHGLI